MLPAQAELIRTNVPEGNCIPVAAACITGYIRDGLVYYKTSVPAGDADIICTKTYDEQATQGIIESADEVGVDTKSGSENSVEEIAVVVYITDTGSKYQQSWCRHLAKS
jgi:hypothetical protein